MNKYDIAVDMIKQSVSTIDVANALGWEVRHGRCKCPIHNGDGFNCRLYPGNRGYICWVCKSSGDVISLVRKYFNGMSFRDAVHWFDSTFHLGLDIDGKIDPQKQREAEIALLRRKRAIEFEAWKERMAFDMSLTADDVVRKLEEIRDAHRPRTYGPWDEAFCMAVRLLPEARRFAEDSMMDCTKKGGMT